MSIYRANLSLRSKSADYSASPSAPANPRTLIHAQNKQRLFVLYRKYPHLIGGDPGRGGIAIVTDPIEIQKIEDMMFSNFLNSGKSALEALEGSRVGVVSEDRYFIQIRDAVIFANGKKGLYNRQHEQAALQGAQGAAILPVLSNGDVLLNHTFRHAMRGWSFEIPRGFSNPGEPPCQTARRELEEETGQRPSSPILLGRIAPNTGASAITPSLFFCPIVGEGKLKRGKEAIKNSVAFSVEEVSQAIFNGYFEYEGEQVPFNDGFSLAALLKAHVAGLITLPQNKPA